MIPYIKDFLTQAEADALFGLYMHRHPARAKNPRNNKSFIRKLHYGAYTEFPSRHVGVTIPIAAAPDEIKSLAAKLTAYAGKTVNYLSVLGYENESDHIGWHQHKEDRVQEDQSVWVVSLGDRRTLSMRRLGCKDKTQYEYLHPAHGSLYVLPCSFNTTHEHAIRDDEFPCGLRISINCKHIPPQTPPVGKPDNKKDKPVNRTGPQVVSPDPRGQGE